MKHIAPAFGRYLSRIAFSALGSELIPAFLRTRILRTFGAQIPDSSCIWSGCKVRSPRLVFGRNVFINVGFFFDGAAQLTVGNNVRMGQFVSVITATHAIGPPEQRCEIEPVCRDVRIEDGCWIGTRVTIMPGVAVRRGCVIGAGSVVLHDTEPDGVYAGTPARRIRDLRA